MQWLYSYILISHTLLFRADCGNTPSDFFHVVTCGVMLIAPFDFLEGCRLQPTCVQHCPPVLNFIQAHPPGQRENQKWKAKIALLILHSSVSFWEKKKKNNYRPWLRVKNCRCRSLAAMADLPSHNHSIQEDWIQKQGRARTWLWTMTSLLEI